MTDPDPKRTRIKQKIAASQDRLKRESAAAPARTNLADRDPPETYRSLAAEYPWLSVAGGVALGLLAGALLPKGAGSKLGRRVVAAATIASELGLAFGKSARAKAEEAGREGAARLSDLGETVGEGAADLRQRATMAANRTRSSGLKLAGQAIRLAARVRR